jgi:hypothetical protein
LYARTVSKFVPGRDFAAFVCFIYDIKIPEFNNIIDRVIGGPKPTSRSNTNQAILYKGATDGILDWIEENPDKISIEPDNGGIKKYITIPKTVFESLVPENLVDYVREKLGVDHNGMMIYDSPSITNLFFRVNGRNLIMPEGHGCHQLYDSSELDVVQFFTDKSRFTILCIGLVIIPTKDTYKYQY